jgi:hypothetical protein
VRQLSHPLTTRSPRALQTPQRPLLSTISVFPAFRDQLCGPYQARTWTCLRPLTLAAATSLRSDILEILSRPQRDHHPMNAHSSRNLFTQKKFPGSVPPRVPLRRSCLPIKTPRLQWAPRLPRKIDRDLCSCLLWPWWPKASERYGYAKQLGLG